MVPNGVDDASGYHATGDTFAQHSATYIQQDEDFRREIAVQETVIPLNNEAADVLRSGTLARPPGATGSEREVRSQSTNTAAEEANNPEYAAQSHYTIKTSIHSR